MLEVTIDGKTIVAEEGEFILQAAARNNIKIPTLCHHSALAGLGSCRLCIVEVNEGGGNRVVASCVYPLKKSCEVWTQSEKIRNERRVIISMLHDRAPEDPYLLSLCDEYNAPKTNRYLMPPDLTCVLCGRCARACRELGTGAISTVGRGTGKKVSTPYDECSPDCIGCGACAKVCPIGAIGITETKATRGIWNKTFTLVRCAKCGKPFATEEEIAHLREKLSPHGAVNVLLCPDCRKRTLNDDAALKASVLRAALNRVG
jgi:NADH dehydrogenase/NADH:ubiquinone oxidoreductase subunit G